MYFQPLLFALLTYLLFPSTLLSAAAGLGTWAYLAILGGEKPDRSHRASIRAKLAYRVLCVKLLHLNGEPTEHTYDVHADLVPDEPEFASLRGDLRVAASRDTSAWKPWAKDLRRYYGWDTTLLEDRLKFLIVQLKAGPQGITDDTQDRLIEIAKLWGFGPRTLREYLEWMKTEPSPSLLAWKK